MCNTMFNKPSLSSDSYWRLVFSCWSLC